MHKALSNQKIAILVANGFYEDDFTQTQRALQAAGANIKIIGMDSGLVNSWTGQSWGHNFATDMLLNSALAADFSMLVIPSGRRSVDKLKLTAHTKRFIGGFMDASKPITAFGNSVELLAFSERLDGVDVICPEESKTVVQEAGGNIVSSSICVDGHVLTGNTEDTCDLLDAMLEHFSNAHSLKAAA